MVLLLKVFSQSVQDLVKLISKQTKAHWLSVNLQINIRSSSNQLWSPPQTGWLKLNTDAAFSFDKGHCGVILKNDLGSILLAAVNHFSCMDAISAECIAILDACKIINNLKLEQVIFESDSLIAISWLNGHSNNRFWTASPVIEQIRKIWNGWPSWIFKFVPRSANGAAHALAKWASFDSFVGFIDLDSIPISVFCDRGFPLVNSLF
ncbi:hypothetical protein CASFOL_009662 [Castilleja foliolosa]|uniref:RNase H type-1 domain-containing protein n=1 Tax=Castilleja foliolosa TaxID=1961234 RepID=A0ABD3DS74_9LAMI